MARRLYIFHPPFYGGQGGGEKMEHVEEGEEEQGEKGKEQKDEALGELEEEVGWSLGGFRRSNWMVSKRGGGEKYNDGFTYQ